MNIKRIGLIGGSGVPVGGSSGTGSSTTVVDNLESLSKSAALSANMGRELNEAKAPKVGYAPDLKVSYAEELVGRGESTPEAIGAIRPTSGEESSIKDGNATIERIKGESVVWNQGAANLWNVANCTITFQDGVYVITPKAEGRTQVGIRYLGNIISDAFSLTHTYLCTASVKCINTKNVVLGQINSIGDVREQHYVSETCSTTWQKISFIWKEETASNKYYPSCIKYTAADVSDVLYVRDWNIYDLTKMFNGVNVPTTIEDFEARKPLGVTNEYNEGTIVSFQGGNVKSVGFNAFTAENSEAGSISTINGAHITHPEYKRSDFLPCVSNTKYEVIKCNHFYQYDSERKFIQHNPLGDGDNPPNHVITLTDKTCYVRVVYRLKNESSVCLHLVHSGYRNGEYEPYVEDVHPLPDIKSIKDSNGDVLFPYGLLSAGSVHDEITATKAIKRIGVVDIGTLDWLYQAGTGWKRFRCTIEDRAPSTKVVQTLYRNISLSDMNDIDMGIDATNGQGYLYISNYSYDTANSFKQAMQGVLLYYELAEPIEVDLEEPLNMTYEAWDFGTEELVAKDATTPLNADIVYLFNAVDRIRENSTHIDEITAHYSVDGNVNITKDRITLGTMVDISGDKGIRIGTDEDSTHMIINSTDGIQIGTSEYGIRIKPGFNSENTSSIWEVTDTGINTTSGLIDKSFIIRLGTALQIGLDSVVTIGINGIRIDTYDNLVTIGTGVYISSHVMIGTKTSNLTDEITYIEKGLQFSLLDNGALKIKNTNTGKYTIVELTQTE